MYILGEIMVLSIIILELSAHLVKLLDWRYPKPGCLWFDSYFFDNITNSSRACLDKMKSVQMENLSIHFRQTLWEQILVFAEKDEIGLVIE